MRLDRFVSIQCVKSHVTPPRHLLVLIQTYIGKLKSTIKDLEAQLNTDDAHAHYHGGERCTGTHDHG